MESCRAKQTVLVCNRRRQLQILQTISSYLLCNIADEALTVLAFDLRYIIHDLKHIYLIWPVTNGWKKWMVSLPTNTKVACPAMFLALGSGGISMEVSGGGATTIMISDISPWLPPGARCRLNWPSFGEGRALGLIYWRTVYV